MVGSEHFPGFLSRFLEIDDHEATHQKCCVGLLCIVKGGVVIYLVGLVL